MGDWHDWLRAQILVREAEGLLRSDGAGGRLAATSPDDPGRWIASAGEDSTVKVWDSRTGKLHKSFPGHARVVTRVAFSRDGPRLYSGSEDKTIKVWDVSRLSDGIEK